MSCSRHRNHSEDHTKKLQNSQLAFWLDHLDSLEDSIDVCSVSEDAGTVLVEDALVLRPHHQGGAKEGTVALQVAINSGGGGFPVVP